MTDKLKRILFRRENGGFLLALVAVYTIDQIVEPYGALLSFVLIFGGLRLVHKYLR